jgi:hypothetical protein
MYSLKYFLKELESEQLEEEPLIRGHELGREGLLEDGMCFSIGTKMPNRQGNEKD